MRLQGTTALVTGASSGIGLAFAEELSRRGASRIVLVARRADRLQRTAEAIGPHAEAYAADLSNTSAVSKLLEDIGPVDVLINNAGFGWADAFSEQEFDRLGNMIDLNCKTLVQLTEGCLGPMLQAERGWILNVGSTAGLVPTPGLAVDAASKAFVNHFTEALRIELQGSGIRVHLLAPGPVETEFFAVARPGSDPSAKRPLGFIFEDASSVARQALDAMLMDRPRSIPGRGIRWAYGFASILPLSVIRPLVGLGANGLDRLLNKEESNAR